MKIDFFNPELSTHIKPIFDRFQFKPQPIITKPIEVLKYKIYKQQNVKIIDHLKIQPLKQNYIKLDVKDLKYSKQSIDHIKLDFEFQKGVPNISSYHEKPNLFNFGFKNANDVKIMTIQQEAGTENSLTRRQKDLKGELTFDEQNETNQLLDLSQMIERDLNKKYDSIFKEIGNNYKSELGKINKDGTPQEVELQKTNLKNTKEREELQTKLNLDNDVEREKQQINQKGMDLNKKIRDRKNKPRIVIQPVNYFPNISNTRRFRTNPSKETQTETNDLDVESKSNRSSISSVNSEDNEYLTEDEKKMKTSYQKTLITRRKKLIEEHGHLLNNRENKFTYAQQEIIIEEKLKKTKYEDENPEEASVSEKIDLFEAENRLIQSKKATLPRDHLTNYERNLSNLLNSTNKTSQQAKEIHAYSCISDFIQYFEGDKRRRVMTDTEKHSFFNKILKTINKQPDNVESIDIEYLKKIQIPKM
jgi:hypothetical protein